VPDTDLQSLISSSMSNAAHTVLIDKIYPYIDPSLKALLGKQIKKEMLPKLQTKVRKQLMQEVTEQYKVMTQQEIKQV
jgi:glycerol kinase